MLVTGIHRSLSRTIAESAADDDALGPGFYYIFFAQCTKNLQISFHVRHAAT